MKKSIIQTSSKQHYCYAKITWKCGMVTILITLSCRNEILCVHQLTADISIKEEISHKIFKGNKVTFDILFLSFSVARYISRCGWYTQINVRWCAHMNCKIYPVLNSFYYLYGMKTKNMIHEIQLFGMEAKFNWLLL